MLRFTGKIAAIMMAMLMVCGCECAKTAAAPRKQSLKVLMVGNSFSWSCRRYLPDVAKSVPGCDLHLEVGNIGGCSLEGHIRAYEKTLADPAHRIYLNSNAQRASLPELLKREKWDIISIQQASHFSWRPESFQPWADKLIAIIRETNPQAEIVIQQTWSYNNGDPRLHPGTPNSWGISQTGMYERLAANYRDLAEAKKIRVVPMGLAVQLSRADSPQQFPVMTADEKAKYKYPEKLPSTADMVGALRWLEPVNGKRRVSADMIHLNRYGDYMQACLWFAFLFDRNVEEITFRPEGLDPAQIEKARRCAQQALDQYQQVK